MLSEKKIGIVAHFYMDPEVQGVLSSAAARWPHIHISDSLVMADRAVKMAEEGCTTVAVLGVDFMSENVAAILKEAGHGDVKVRGKLSSNCSHKQLCMHWQTNGNSSKLSRCIHHLTLMWCQDSAAVNAVPMSGHVAAQEAGAVIQLVHTSLPVVAVQGGAECSKQGCTCHCIHHCMLLFCRGVLPNADIRLVIQVYRMDPNEIGCSLAEAAETPLYNDYLAVAAHTGQPAMHVVYINTSLKTKATAHAVVPTITCTSSNVVQTVLQVSCCCTYYVHVQ